MQEKDKEREVVGLRKDVLDRLDAHGIADDEYRFKMGKYHTEGREGVPYRMLIIKKDLPAEMRTTIELELAGVDQSLCVIFKRPAPGVREYVFKR